MNFTKQSLVGMLAAFAGMVAVTGMAQQADVSPPPANQVAAAPAADSVPPPSAPPKLGAAELDKLVAPIALYPDPLVATILPASVYPLEIVQAARFVADTNNIAKIDDQPWDDNVKAVARVPAALKQLNDDLPWTIQLGEAFLAQDKDVMDAIQRLRLKSEKSGMLRTSEQMVVVVTNTITETTVQQQVVVVTNTIVQIEPANPQVIYVPQYNPVYVYAPPPTYVYSPYDPFLTFAAGVAVGVWIGNSCDWHHGGCYHGGNYNGGHNTKIKVEGDVNIGSGNRNNIGSGNRGNGNRVNPQGGQKWQPNQSRLNKSGAASGTSARSQEARGYGSGGARPSTGAVGNRPSTGTAGTRPSTGAAGTRPSTGTATTRPTTGTAPTGNRPSTGGGGPDVVRGSGSSASASRPSPSQSSASRPSSSAGGGNNAFSGAGGSGASARQSSSRGSTSRSSGGGMSRGGGGGGSRGGGGGRGR